ncbi:MAG: hypothetical protein KDD40_02190, partial [Bdellovibrionales bacterium]|nr:hypothetical protein [Bdellovibrionales bacterium]
MNWRLILLLSISTILFGCNGGDNRPNIELIPNMFDQVSLKAQDWDPNKDGKGSQLTPPEHAVPRGKVYLAHMSGFADAENNLKNPWANDYSPEIIE